MSGESPIVILSDNNSNYLAVQNGSATPASTPALMVAGSDGTNSRYVTLDTSGRQLMVGAGTAGTPVGGIITIQGVSGGTVIPTNLSQVGGNAVTTQSNGEQLIAVEGRAATGAAVTGNPILSGGSDGTDARTMLTDISGRQIIVGAAADGAPFAGNPILIGGQDGTNAQAILTDTTGRLVIVGAGTIGNATGGVVSVQVPDTNTTSALGALNAAVTISTEGNTGVGIQLAAGTLIGTIVAEISVDGGTTWVGTLFNDPVTGNFSTTIVFASSNTAVTRSLVGSAGASNVRVRVSAYTSGTANCNIRASSVFDPSITFAGAFGATVQPPDAAQIAGWDTTTATLLIPSVKPPSVVPLATDQALVVILSPNQQAIPVTTSPVTSVPGIAQGYVVTTSKNTVPVRATTYTEQSTNFTGSIVSSSATDSSAGTGARTLIITYVNATGTTQATETVTLNGTTAVNLVNTTKCFIQSMVVSTVGSNGANAGTITLFTGTGGTGTNVGSIAIGDKRTFWAHHYVISGKTCHVTDFTGLNNSTTVQSLFVVQAQSIPTVNAPSITVGDWVIGDTTFQIQRTFGSTVNVVGPASVVLFVEPSGVTSIQSQGSFTFYDE